MQNTNGSWLWGQYDAKNNVLIWPRKLIMVRRLLEIVSREVVMVREPQPHIDDASALALV